MNTQNMQYKHLDTDKIKNILNKKGMQNIDITEDAEIRTESIWAEYKELPSQKYLNESKFHAMRKQLRSLKKFNTKVALVVDSDVDGLAFASIWTRQESMLRKSIYENHGAFSTTPLNIECVYTEKYETRGLKGLLKFKDSHGEDNKVKLEEAEVIVVGDMGTNELELLLPYAQQGKLIFVIDHHKVKEGTNVNIHENIVLINPQQEGCPSSCKHISATHILHDLIGITDTQKYEEYNELLEMVALANAVDGTLGLPQSRTYVTSVYASRKLRPNGVISSLMERRFTNTRIIMPSHIGENVGIRLNLLINRGSFGLAFNFINRDYIFKIDDYFVEGVEEYLFDFYDYEFLDKKVSEYRKYRAEMTQELLANKILLETEDMVIIEGYKDAKDRLTQTGIISQLTSKMKKMVLIIGFYEGYNGKYYIGGSYRHFNNNTSAYDELNKMDIEIKPQIGGHDNAGGYLAVGFDSIEHCIEHLVSVALELEGKLLVGLDKNRVEYTINIREFYTTHTYKEYKEMINEFKFLANVLQRYRIQLSVRFEDILIDNVFNMKGDFVRVDSHRHNLQLPFFNATLEETELLKSLNDDLTYNYITVEGELFNNLFAQGSKGKLRSNLQVVPSKFELKTITGMNDRKVERFTSDEWYEYASKKYGFGTFATNSNSINTTQFKQEGNRISVGSIMQGRSRKRY